MSSKTKKHSPVVISPAMHYAVVIALIISLITSFLLGMLLVELPFSYGLKYFSHLSDPVRIQRAHAASVAPIITTTRTVVYEGYVETIVDPDNDLDASIADGAKMYAVVTFRDNSAYAGTPGIEWGNYTVTSPTKIFIGDAQWTTLSPSNITVHNAPPGRDYVSTESSGIVGMPYSSFSVGAGWDKLDVLTGNGIPRLNLSTDEDGSGFSIQENGGMGWSIMGEVTRVVSM